VEEVLRLYRSLYREGRSVGELLELFELTPKRDSRYHTLSGGQKQRLSVAVALVGNPELLFLDEPTTGLDPQARLSLWKVIESCVQDGVTVVMTTHYMEEAARLCDRVAIFDRGKVIALGTPEELVASLGADQVIEFALSNEVDLDVFRNLNGVIGALRRLDRYMLNVKDVQRALPAVLRAVEAHGAELTHAAIHRATLDDVFIQLTGRNLRDA
jgi:ABC-2 type transport system ATP-binding protein